MWIGAHHALRTVNSAMQRKGWDTEIFLTESGEYLHMQERVIKNDFHVPGFGKRLHGNAANWEYKKRKRMAAREKLSLKVLSYARHTFWESQAGE